jgi:hypothetical protein
MHKTRKDNTFFHMTDMRNKRHYYNDIQCSFLLFLYQIFFVIFLFVETNCILESRRIKSRSSN